MIRGNRDALAEIGFIEAEPIDIGGVEITSDLPVIPRLPSGVEVASGSYNIHVGIVIRGISSKSFEYEPQDIEIRGLGEGYKAYINTPTLSIRVAGSDTMLDSAVKAEFKPHVDIAGLEAGIHIVPVVIEHDKALSSLEIIPNEVHVTISEDL